MGFSPISPVATAHCGFLLTDQSMDLRHIRDNLGHESLTSSCLHTADDARHQEPEAKHWVDWKARRRSEPADCHSVVIE